MMDAILVYVSVALILFAPVVVRMVMVRRGLPPSTARAIRRAERKRRLRLGLLQRGHQ